MRASDPVASDDILGGDFPRRTLGVGHADFAGAYDFAEAVDHLHLVLFQQEFHALRQLGDHLGFARQHGGPIDGNIVVDNAEFLGVPDIVVDVGAEQQVLGGNAANVQACPAPLVILLNDRGFQAQLAGAYCRHVSAGAAANHYQVVLGSFCQDRTSK